MISKAKLLKNQNQSIDQKVINKTIDSKRLGKFSAIRIDILTESNFHVCKPKINLVLRYREIDDVVEDKSTPDVGRFEYKAWVQRDEQVVRALIDLSLSS